MCGICGLRHAAGRAAPVPAELLGRMCRTIVHRGPDDEGVYVERPRRPGQPPPEHHRRRGRPPAAVQRGRLGLDRLQRRGLQLRRGPGRAHRPAATSSRPAPTPRRSSTPTRNGAPGLHRPLPGHVRLRPLGQAERGTLLLVRDRIGIKPLYYTLLPDGTLVFGSELKTDPRPPGRRARGRAPGPRPLPDPRIRPGPAIRSSRTSSSCRPGIILTWKDGRIEVQKVLGHLAGRSRRSREDRPRSPPSRTSSTPCSRNRSSSGSSATSRSARS